MDQGDAVSVEGLGRGHGRGRPTKRALPVGEDVSHKRARGATVASVDGKADRWDDVLDDVFDDGTESTNGSSANCDEQGRLFRTCKLCGCGCFDPTPLTSASGMQWQWGEQIPWYRGTMAAPTGNFCNICVCAYRLGMMAEHGPLRGYIKKISADPSIHAEAFPQRRSKWIANHNANPGGRVGVSAVQQTAVDVGNRQDDQMEAPEEEFVTEEAWANEVEQRTKNRPRRQDHPELQWHQRKFRGQMIWGYRELVGKRGRFKLRKKDTTFVQKSNRIHEGPELREGEADAKVVAACDAMLLKAADVAAFDFESMLKAMEGGDEQPDDCEDGADSKAEEQLETENQFKTVFQSYGASSGPVVGGVGGSGSKPSSARRVGGGGGGCSSSKSLPAKCTNSSVKGQDVSVFERISKATASCSAPGKATSGGQAGKYDIAKDLKWEKMIREKLDAASTFDQSFVDPLSHKQLGAIGKQLVEQRSKSQAVATQLSAKIKSSIFRKNAPERLMDSFILMKQRADCVFKLTKYMSQTYITDPDVFQEAIQQAIELKIDIPVHFHLHCVRINAMHHVKTMHISSHVKAMLQSSMFMDIAIKSGQVDQSYVTNFVASIVESTAAKFLAKTTVKEVDQDDGKTEENITAVGRLRLYHHVVAEELDCEEVANSCRDAYALLSPYSVPVSVLHAAMSRVVIDSPGPILKPFQAGGAPQALLAKAVDALEFREAEHKTSDELSRTNTLLDKVDTSRKHDQNLETIEEVQSGMTNLRALVERSDSSEHFATMKTIEDKLEITVVKHVLKPLGHDVAFALRRWCDDMRTSACSEVRLDSPLGQDSEHSKESVLSMTKPFVGDRQLKSCEVLYDAQATLSEIFSVDVGTYSAVASAALLKQTHAKVITQSTILQQDFAVELPEDFKELVHNFVGAAVSSQLDADIQRFVRSAIGALKKTGCLSTETEKEVNLMASSVLRLMTAMENADLQKHVVCLQEMVVGIDIDSKLANAPSLNLQPTSDTNVLKILDLSANGHLMALRELTLNNYTRDKTACRSALVWAKGRLSMDIDHDVSISDEETEATLALVAANINAIDELYGTRTNFVKTILDKHHDKVKEVIQAIPPLERDGTNQKFVDHITKTNLATTTVKKLGTETMKIRSAMVKLKMTEHISQLGDIEKSLGKARGLVCSFTALILMANPKTANRHKQGDTLRKQLNATKDMFESKSMEYGESVPEWLKQRVHVALGIQAAAAPGEAAEVADAPAQAQA